MFNSLAGNRVLAMIARARQAEAKTNLAQIHQLQGTFQLYSDNYAQWGNTTTTVVGFNGTANRNCDIDAGTIGKTSTHDGAKKLGFKPKGCNDMRYGYWIIVNSAKGKERYLAVAYASSNNIARIYPTCDGTNDIETITHEKKGTTDYSGLTVTNSSALLGGAAKGGDLMGVSEEKVWHHGDIVTDCEK